MQVTTLIGYGSPNRADTHDVHGAPLGAEETAATRANLKWEYPEFDVPKDVYDVMRSNVAKGAAAQAEWNSALSAYKAKYPKARARGRAAGGPATAAAAAAARDGERSGGGEGEGKLASRTAPCYKQRRSGVARKP